VRAARQRNDDVHWRLAVTETRHEIRSEERGSHWVAWLTGPGETLPAPVLMVGKTQDEAESRLREWLSARQSR
jgi:hypothetical protein